MDKQGLQLIPISPLIWSYSAVKWSENISLGQVDSKRSLSSCATLWLHTAHWLPLSSQLKHGGCSRFHFVLRGNSLPTLHRSGVVINAQLRPAPISDTAIQPQPLFKMAPGLPLWHERGKEWESCRLLPFFWHQSFVSPPWKVEHNVYFRG